MVSKPSLETLIRHQHTDGYWNMSAESVLKEFIAGSYITDAAVEGMLSEVKIENSNINSRCVYLTLVALFVLKEEFDGRKGEWQLIAKKARDFLKNVGLTKTDAVIRKFTLKIKTNSE